MKSSLAAYKLVCGSDDSGDEGSVRESASVDDTSVDGVPTGTSDCPTFNVDLLLGRASGVEHN